MSAKKLEFLKHEVVSLRNHSNFNEKWLEDRICEDPSILDLGLLEVKDRQRVQPKAGRLDLLLYDPDTSRRYEVEIQLGKTDESHIIRTIEYWDIERKRYPQFDHCAVIIAEDITSRFLNVISLFNSHIPLICIQLKAITIQDKILLTFTKVLDEIQLGVDDEDSDLKVVTDRNYWKKTKSNDKNMELFDSAFEQFVLSKDSEYKPNYLKHYIGIVDRDGKSTNFVTFKPRKSNLVMNFKLPRTTELDKKIESAGLDYDYNNNHRYYFIRVNQSDMKENLPVLQDLVEACYSNYF